MDVAEWPLIILPHAIISIANYSLVPQLIIFLCCWEYSTANQSIIAPTDYYFYGEKIDDPWITIHILFLCVGRQSTIIVLGNTRLTLRLFKTLLLSMI
jgi:hypothetical protein